MSGLRSKKGSVTLKRRVDVHKMTLPLIERMFYIVGMSLNIKMYIIKTVIADMYRL